MQIIGYNSLIESVSKYVKNLSLTLDSIKKINMLFLCLCSLSLILSNLLILRCVIFCFVVAIMFDGACNLLGLLITFCPVFYFLQ